MDPFRARAGQVRVRQQSVNIEAAYRPLRLGYAVQ